MTCQQCGEVKAAWTITSDILNIQVCAVCALIAILMSLTTPKGAPGEMNVNQFVESEENVFGLVGNA